MESSHNHKNGVELDQCFIRQFTVPDIHLHHFFAIFGVYHYLRTCVLLINYRNDGIKPLLQLKRGVKEPLITPILSPRIWMMVFFSINSSQSKQVPSICILIRSQCMSNSSLVPSNIPCSSITHVLLRKSKSHFSWSRTEVVALDITEILHQF